MYIHVYHTYNNVIVYNIYICYIYLLLKSKKSKLQSQKS